MPPPQGALQGRMVQLSTACGAGGPCNQEGEVVGGSAAAEGELPAPSMQHYHKLDLLFMVYHEYFILKPFSKRVYRLKE